MATVPSNWASRYSGERIIGYKNSPPPSFSNQSGHFELTKLFYTEIVH